MIFICSTVLRIVSNIRTKIEEKNEYICIPDLKE